MYAPEEDSADIPLDELGFEAYIPEHPEGAHKLGVQVEVPSTPGVFEKITPWELEGLDLHRSCPAVNFAVSIRFWWLVESAVRVALVGLLPTAVLLYATYDNGHGPWKSQSLLIVGSLVGPLLRSETIGLQILYIGVYIRASLVWVPILTVATAIRLYDHLAASFIVYAAFIFLIASLMEGITRKLTMVFLTLMYMDFLRTRPLPGNEIRYVHLWAEVALGTAFGFVSALVPWPNLSSTFADRALQDVAKSTTTALQGLASSFWTDTNLTRNVQMVRVRFMLQSIENGIGEVKKHFVGAEHEWMLQSSQRRGLRMLKLDLFVKLHRNLVSIRRVVDIVRDKPATISHSERAVLFGNRLGKRITAVCVAVDELLYHINRSQTYDQLINNDYFEKVETAHKELEQEFQSARREYFFETHVEHLEEFVPLMTFYVFCVSQIVVTLTRVKAIALREHQTRHALGCGGMFKKFLMYAFEYFAFPLFATVPHFRNIFIRRCANDVRFIIEAVKISAAMVASLVFYYYIDSTYAFLSGPTIIAFTASATPAEALVNSVPRLTGTLSGVVVGFFIANNAETAVARVAGLTTFVFCCRLCADLKVIGPALMYASFIAVSQLSVIPLTESATMSRIQQSTFAIIIYMVITFVVFPCRPTTLIREAQSDAIIRIARAYESIITTFVETGETYQRHQQQQREKNAINGIAPADSNEPIQGDAVAPNKIDFPTAAFADIERQLNEIDRFLLASQNLIPLAVDEPRLIATPFPLRSMQDAQTALKKIVAIMRTMSESVRWLRERQQAPSPELTGYLRNVVPLAKDTIAELQKYTILMAKLVVDRRLDLSAELTKSSQAFSRMCNAFHRRKSHIFMHLLRDAITRAGVHQKTPGHSQLRRGHHHQPSSRVPYGGLERSQVDIWSDAAIRRTSPSIATHEDGGGCSRTPTVRNEDDALQLEAPHELTLLNSCGIEGEQPSQEGLELAGFDENAGESSEPSPSEGTHRRRPKRRSILENKVALPPTFTMPITSHDSESLHTMTFSIVLLATELRNLLVAVEDSLQHRHVL
ncbi:transmembrane protein, putative [Bodo saltans]|uniref:Transmembrane protein, putative n=1 Tax=Bodo saltans TaxID=75058 RepID=A0A0S4JFT8_BODSA|nr:transmembrane protein, putative [Bodo saltans]|eukprot:CUG88821.1 transmembrane protein, putative [Bodo saltans]